MPTADEAAAEARPADERPVAMRYAIVMWVIAGVVAVVNGIDLLLRKQQLVDAWTRAKDPGVTNEQVERGATTLLWMFLVGAVVFAVLFALFAYKARDGVRRARIMLTVLCVVTVAFYVTILRTPFGLLTAMLAVAATVLLYLPSSNRFFAPRDLPI